MQITGALKAHIAKTDIDRTKKIKRAAGLAILLLMAGATSRLSAQNNPIVRNIYSADPSAHVWKDGRLYLYPSHDVAPPRGCDLMDKYHVYSTDDIDRKSVV